MPRYARKVDSTQGDIVKGLRSYGCLVYIIKEPCDLLVQCRGVWYTLECKPPKRNRKDQESQDEFLDLTGTPKVRSLSAALVAVGLVETVGLK